MRLSEEMSWILLRPRAFHWRVAIKAPSTTPAYGHSKTCPQVHGVMAKPESADEARRRGREEKQQCQGGGGGSARVQQDALSDTHTHKKEKTVFFDAAVCDAPARASLPVVHSHTRWTRSRVRRLLARSCARCTSISAAASVSPRQCELHPRRDALVEHIAMRAECV